MKRKLSKLVLASLLFNIPLLASVSSSDIKPIVVKSKSSFIKRAYADNLYAPIWIKDSSLSNLGKELLVQIKKDKTVASDLPFYKLYRDVNSDVKAGKLNAKTEFKIMKLYKSYMDYLIRGGINWKAFDADMARLIKKYNYKTGWEHKTPPYSSAKILESAILSGSFGDYFTKVEPTRFKYKKLKKYLEKYIAIKKDGGWKTIKGGTTLKVGDSNPNIPIIRKRLKIVGDLGQCSDSMSSPVYDNCMAKAVKRFKLRHGFKGTTVIDRLTRNEFKKPVSYYIRKMRLNLDRIKWSNRKEARVRIELNIPAFRLYLYDGKGLVTTMRVITGKPNHPTPVFSNVMTTVVVNPYWRIPQSIVKAEMIKHLLKNPHYYDRQHKYLYNGWGPKADKINPATVNWKKYANNKTYIPYHFMQAPGSHNALGKIKFLFPNKYSVYIHDTPGKRRFFSTTRAFSHGCMRIQKPRELLEALALYNSNLNVDDIMKRLGTSDNKQIGLRRRIPVDITYFTSFVDDYGYLHFARDIYTYDRLQLKHYYKGNIVANNPKVSKSIKKKKVDTKKKVNKKAVEKKSKKSINKKETKKSTAKKIDKNEANLKPIKVKPTKPKSAYEVIEIGY